MRSSSIVAMTAALGLCLSAGMASADTTTSLGFTPVGTGTLTDPYHWNAAITNLNVKNSNGANPGGFLDLFTFTNPANIPVGATGGGNADGIALAGSGTLVFSSMSLIDQTTHSLVQAGVIGLNSLGQSTANLFNFILSSNTDTYAIQVEGNVNNGTTASYGGTVSISAVPEPKTYAMLLAGLGLLAFTARRRKANFF